MQPRVLAVVCGALSIVGTTLFGMDELEKYGKLPYRPECYAPTGAVATAKVVCHNRSGAVLRETVTEVSVLGRRGEQVSPVWIEVTSAHCQLPDGDELIVRHFMRGGELARRFDTYGPQGGPDSCLVERYVVTRQGHVRPCVGTQTGE